MLVAPGEGVHRVDRRLALDPADLAEPLRDRPRRQRYDHNVRVRAVTAVAPERLDVVPGRLPPLRQAATDLSSSHNRDLHCPLPPVVVALATNSSTGRS